MTREDMEKKKQEFIEEEKEKLKSMLLKDFEWNGEDSREYKYLLQVELKECIGYFSEVRREFIDDFGRHDYIELGNVSGRSDFKAIVLDTVLPWAIEHTECFGSEKATLENIESILEYNPDSIEQVVKHIVDKLDENIVSSILEKHPEFKEFISREKDLTPEVAAIEAKLIELEEALKSTKMSMPIRAQLKMLLERVQGICTECEGRGTRAQEKDKNAPSLD